MDTASDLLDELVLPGPERVALRRGPDALGPARLDANARALAAELEALPDATPVGLRLGNTPAFVSALLACLRARRPVVVLDPRQSEAELDGALASAPVAVVLHADAGRPDGPGWCALDDDGRCVPGAVTRAARACRPLPDVAVVHWSSGSTGTPKPMAVSREALAFRVRSLSDAFSLGPADRVLCLVPLTHCHGLDCIALPALAARAELVLLDPLAATPERVAAEVARRGITLFSAFPRLYEQLLAADLDPAALAGVRLPLCGSAALEPRVAEAFARRFGTEIRTGYGLTEVGTLAMNHHDRPPLRRDSVGPVLPGIEWRLDAPDEDGVGELWVRSPGCADRYLEADGSPGAPLASDWLRTQDLARVDDDAYLYLVGRRSSFVNVDGAKVDPREVERAVAELDWVDECAVRGVGDPAERLVAWVSPPAPAGVDGPAEVRRHVAARLSGYKVPAQVVELVALPRNTLGKLLYPELPDPAPAAPPRAATPPAAGADDLERAVAEIWRRVLHLATVGRDDHFMDLGGTSVQLAELHRSLTEELGVEIDVLELFEHPSVAAQVRLIGSRR